MNLTDLRDVLDERSHHARIPAGLERMAGVRARVSAIRQRRAAAIGALALAGLMIIWYGLVAQRSPGTVAVRPVSSPASGYRLIDGFPEYADGAKVVATANASTHDVLRVTAIAGELGFAFVTRCALPAGFALILRSSANGAPLGDVTCGATFRPGDDMLASIGARAGDRITFVFSAVQTQYYQLPADGSPAPASNSSTLPDGTVSVAVMRRLDFAAYPFPPRPARLAPLSVDRAANGATAVTVIDSMPNPLAPIEVPVVVAGNADLDMVAQTPGFLRVYLDGRLQERAEWWDYAQGVYAVTLRPNEVGSRTLTLRLVPEHMTGAWRAVLHTPQS
jgi:hypothetical protein